MAEGAAEAIAQRAACTTGAMYPRVGKLRRPQYPRNQNGQNIHDTLSPRKRRVLYAHQKDAGHTSRATVCFGDS